MQPGRPPSISARATPRSAPSRPGLAGVALLGTLLLAAAAPGQPADPFAPQPTTPATPVPPDGTQEITIDDVMPQLRAGYKAEFLRQLQQTIPVVVIVPDTASYVEALAAWKPLLRFPVLLDDGTAESRENVARFVRAFKPERVVRWTSPGAEPLDTPDRVRAASEAAHLAVWQYATEAAPRLGDAVKAVCDVEAPGVVVAGPADPAWTAGLALAIGRGQPLLWIDAPQDISGALPKADADALCASIEQSLTELSLPWDQLGDTVDIVALCLNTPARTGTDTQGEWIATTDRLGHTTGQPTDTTRWAWASQIHGSNAQAAYRAMCGLFLYMPTGWFFDSYPSGQPWESFALRFAAETLGGDGSLEISLVERPNNGLVRWRIETLAPLNASLLMVNTRGMRNFFELQDGSAWCGDVPFLGVPAAVHFIHSWSAYRPGDRDTVAGRWFERGAFAYVGAVQEPFLSAFVPPAALASRLRAMAPWAIACRGDSAPAWRIAVFGDPLLVLARPQDRAAEPLPLEGVVSIEDDMKTALRAGRLADAINTLVLLGRDADAARLATRLRAEDPARLTPDVALACLGPLFRQRQPGEFQALYPRLDRAAAADPVLRDMLWFTARSQLPDRGSVMALLRPHIRPDQQTPDTSDLAMLASVDGQREAAITMLTEWRRTRTDAAELKLIDRTMDLLRGR